MLTMLLLLCCGDETAAPRTESPVIVELFTSQGCSACPPADALAEKFVADGRDDLLVLAFHVDTWDNGGWVDEFGSSKFRDRQHAYARAMSQSSAYTPQAVVGGRAEMNGASETDIDTAVAALVEEGQPRSFEVTATREGDKIKVSLPRELRGDGLQTALVQRVAETKVKLSDSQKEAIEQGVMRRMPDFRHVNVVRQLVSQPLRRGRVGRHSLTLPIPKGGEDAEFFVVAYTQSKKGVIGAVGMASVVDENAKPAG